MNRKSISRLPLLIILVLIVCGLVITACGSQRDRGTEAELGTLQVQLQARIYHVRVDPLVGLLGYTCLELHD